MYLDIVIQRFVQMLYTFENFPYNQAIKEWKVCVIFNMHLMHIFFL